MHSFFIFFVFSVHFYLYFHFFFLFQGRHFSLPPPSPTHPPFSGTVLENCVAFFTDLSSLSCIEFSASAHLLLLFVFPSPLIFIPSNYSILPPFPPCFYLFHFLKFRIFSDFLLIFFTSSVSSQFFFILYLVFVIFFLKGGKKSCNLPLHKCSLQKCPKIFIIPTYLCPYEYSPSLLSSFPLSHLPHVFLHLSSLPFVTRGLNASQIIKNCNLIIFLLVSYPKG